MQTRLKVSPSSSCFCRLVKLIWFWFLTLRIEYDKNVFNFNLIYFPPRPRRRLDRSFLFWEYARHFLRALSQFSNKREAGGMRWADWACFLSGVPRWPNEGRNTEDTVSLWKTGRHSRKEKLECLYSKNVCLKFSPRKLNYLWISLSFVSNVRCTMWRYIFTKEIKFEVM